MTDVGHLPDPFDAFLRWAVNDSIQGHPPLCGHQLWPDTLAAECREHAYHDGPHTDGQLTWRTIPTWPQPDDLPS